MQTSYQLQISQGLCINVLFALSQISNGSNLAAGKFIFIFSEVKIQHVKINQYLTSMQLMHKWIIDHGNTN